MIYKIFLIFNELNNISMLLKKLDHRVIAMNKSGVWRGAKSGSMYQNLDLRIFGATALNS